MRPHLLLNLQKDRSLLNLGKFRRRVKNIATQVEQKISNKNQYKKLEKGVALAKQKTYLFTLGTTTYSIRKVNKK